LLVEPQRTNLLTYSEDLTQWTANGEIASTQLVANPLTGQNNATKITKVTSAGDPYVIKSSSLSNGTYTYSVYLWTDVGQPTDVELIMYNSSVSEVYSLIVTLTTIPTRYDLTSTFASTGGTISTRIDLSSTATNQFVYAYGAQLEAGSYATSYIPTTSASVTRNADVISKTGISSLIGQTEGTLFVDFYYDAVNNGVNYVVSSLNNGDYGNSIFIDLFNNSLSSNIFNAYNLESKITLAGLTTARHRLAVAYKLNDIAFYVDGVLVGTDTTASIPTLANINLGYLGSTISTEQSYINASALWPTRLTNTQLAQLTTI
jgi:hypothetical protein